MHAKALYFNREKWDMAHFLWLTPIQDKRWRQGLYKNGTENKTLNIHDVEVFVWTVHIFFKRGCCFPFFSLETWNLDEAVYVGEWVGVDPFHVELHVEHVEQILDDDVHDDELFAPLEICSNGDS